MDSTNTVPLSGAVIVTLPPDWLAKEADMRVAELAWLVAMRSLPFFHLPTPVASQVRTRLLLSVPSTILILPFNSRAFPLPFWLITAVVVLLLAVATSAFPLFEVATIALPAPEVALIAFPLPPLLKSEVVT